MTIRLHVTDRSGNRHQLQAQAAGSLMEVLRELEYGVAAICGGMCSCATCHVYVGPAWNSRLPARGGDEHELVSMLQHHREDSRLACQIQLAPALDGLCVTLAPEE